MLIMLFAVGIIPRKTALQELWQVSDQTGMFSNITDEMIEAASDEIDQGQMGEFGGEPGGNPPEDTNKDQIEQLRRSMDDLHRKANDSREGWIGVDLDGTLAEHQEWQGPTHIGKPVAAMIEQVKRKLAQGYEFKVFTARLSGLGRKEREQAIDAIQDWTEEAHWGAISRDKRKRSWHDRVLG